MEELKAKYGLPAEPLTDEEIAEMAKAKGFDKADFPKVTAMLSAVSAGAATSSSPLEAPARSRTSAAAAPVSPSPATKRRAPS